MLKKNLLYAYRVNIRNKTCLKVGITRRCLNQRINEYIKCKKWNNCVDPNTFKLLAVAEFPCNKALKKADIEVKKVMKRYPLNNGQHGNLEQYDFDRAWMVCALTMTKICVLYRNQRGKLWFNN